MMRRSYLTKDTTVIGLRIGIGKVGRNRQVLLLGIKDETVSVLEMEKKVTKLVHRFGWIDCRGPNQCL